VVPPCRTVTHPPTYHLFFFFVAFLLWWPEHCDKVPCWSKASVWCLGCRVDAGEGFETGAVREALEEAGTMLEC
jgi:hypothetical protein